MGLGEGYGSCDGRQIMNWRPYFLMGDLVSNTGVGAVVGISAPRQQSDTAHDCADAAL